MFPQDSGLIETDLFLGRQRTLLFIVLLRSSQLCHLVLWTQPHPLYFKYCLAFCHREMLGLTLVFPCCSPRLGHSSRNLGLCLEKG